MLFAFIEERHFYLSFSTVTQFCCMNPFAVKEKFSLFCKSYNIILFKLMEFQKHFVVVITSVKSKGGFAKKFGCPLHSIKCDRIHGREILFVRGMEFGENADRVIAGRKSNCFSNMVAFIINIFSACTFRTVTDYTKVLEFHAIRFDNITVINKYDGIVRDPFADSGKIGIKKWSRYATVKMSGKVLTCLQT